MASLFFPQLSSGAIVQYPIKKTIVSRTVTNLLADGSMITLADPGAAKMVWDLKFAELSAADAGALQAHFQACNGPFRAFTFIDPTGNMFTSSADLTNAAWLKDPQIEITGGAADPFGGTGAFVVTNQASSTQTVTQQVTVPANYQYCFSLFVTSAEAASLTLLVEGASASMAVSAATSGNWKRVVANTQLNDPGTQLTVGILLAPGQQVNLYGPQLEAQIQPSRYRPTVANGGVYASAHFTSSTMPVVTDAPNLFSTAFEIQTNI